MLAPCTVSKDIWDVKEDKGKSMMHAKYVLYAKRCNGLNIAGNEA